MHLHPVYDRFPEFAPKLTRRATCELLFFGFIRQYKGLDILIRAIAQLDSRDIFLTIAGECWTDPDRYRHLAEQLGVADRVEFQLRYHSDTEAASLFQRADLVILPYRSASGTGIIPVAYHYGKPIVATNVGGIPDAVLDECTGILVPPEDPQSLAVAIRRACGGQIWGNLEEGLRKMRERMSWEGLSRSLIDLHDILSAAPDRQ
jgi:glycosyltransferase involved in cell wall biosynthesis